MRALIILFLIIGLLHCVEAEKKSTNNVEQVTKSESANAAELEEAADEGIDVEDANQQVRNEGSEPADVTPKATVQNNLEKRSALPWRRRSYSRRRTSFGRRRSYSRRRTSFGRRRSYSRRRTVYTRRRTIYNRRRTVYTRRRTIYNRRRTVYTRRRTIYNRRRTIYTRRRSIYNRRRAVYARRRTIYNRRRTVYTRRRTIYNRRRAVYTRRRTIYNRRRTVYTRRRTIYNRRRSITTRRRSLVSRRRSLFNRRRSLFNRRRSLFNRRRTTYSRRRNIYSRRRSTPKKPLGRVCATTRAKIVRVYVYRRPLSLLRYLLKLRALAHSGLILKLENGVECVLEYMADGRAHLYNARYQIVGSSLIAGWRRAYGIRFTDYLGDTYQYGTTRQYSGTSVSKHYQVTPSRARSIMQSSMGYGYDLFRNNCHLGQERTRRRLGLTVYSPYRIHYNIKTICGVVNNPSWSFRLFAYMRNPYIQLLVKLCKVVNKG